MSRETRPARALEADLWTLDPDIVFLNHGSFGACPEAVLRQQQGFRERMEREPVRFMVRELEPLIDGVRRRLAEFIGADPAGLALVPNATAGVNAVLRSLDLRVGDELLTTSHEYNACRNAMEFVASRAGAGVVVADVPFPISGEDEVIERILESVTPRTRFALLDHVTSQTALVLPIAALVRELAERGVETIVDGAHAPGMRSLDVNAIGAAAYTGNCHKWICAPKGAAFLHVRGELRDTVRPVAISHGANSTRTDRSRYLLEFDWTGTFDPTAWLSIPAALDAIESMAPGGWPEIIERNHRLALAGRDRLCAALAIDPPAPDGMLGSMAALPLPDGRNLTAPALYGDPIQDALLERFAIEVPVVPWPAAPHRVLRISAQLYNRIEEYEFLAERLLVLLEEERAHG